MSDRRYGTGLSRHHLVLTAAGVLAAAAIIGAGLGGYALGHQAARTPVRTPTHTGPAASSPAIVTRTTAAPIAITIRSAMPHPDIYRFSPGAITVHAGQKVRLAISNPGMAMHGIAAPALGIHTMIQPLRDGRPATAQVSFTPTRPGTYSAYCSVYCGSGHARMILRIRVLA